MIKLEELKPILEPLLNEENAAAIIESISAIDKPDDAEERISQAVAAAREEANASWNQRFKNTFFGGNSECESEDTSPEPDNERDPDPEDVTIDDLMFPNGK